MADNSIERDSRGNTNQGSSGAGRGQLNDAEQSQVNEDHNLSGASTWETLDIEPNLEEEERNRQQRKDSK